MICVDLDHVRRGRLLMLDDEAPPEIAMSEIIRSVVPYLIIGLILTALIVLVPEIATWLPQVLGG